MTTYSKDQITNGRVISASADYPRELPPECVADHRKIGENWLCCVVMPAPEPVEQAAPARQPEPPAAVAEEGHYSVEEGFAKLLPWVVGVPAAVVGGLVLGEAVRSKVGRSMTRSLIRGAIYRSVGALTR